MHAIQSQKANADLRGKRKNLRDISKDYKTEEMANHAVFDRKVHQAYLRKEATAFYVVTLVVFGLSLAAVMYIL